MNPLKKGGGAFQATSGKTLTLREDLRERRKMRPTTGPRDSKAVAPRKETRLAFSRQKKKERKEKKWKNTNCQRAKRRRQ